MSKQRLSKDKYFQELRQLAADILNEQNEDESSEPKKESDIQLYSLDHKVLTATLLSHKYNKQHDSIQWDKPFNKKLKQYIQMFNGNDDVNAETETPYEEVLESNKENDVWFSGDIYDDLKDILFAPRYSNTTLFFTVGTLFAATYIAIVTYKKKSRVHPSRVAAQV